MDNSNINKDNKKRLFYLVIFIIIVIILSLTLFIIFNDYSVQSSDENGDSDDIVIDLIDSKEKNYYMANEKVIVSNIRLYHVEEKKYFITFKVTNNTKEVLTLYPKYKIMIYNDNDELIYLNNGMNSVIFHYNDTILW